MLRVMNGDEYTRLDSLGTKCQLDPLGAAEDLRDLETIWVYLEAQERSIELRGPGGAPSVGRAVLEKVWQAPRLGFHRDEKKAGAQVNLGSKVLAVPWSKEALERYQLQGSVTGLILEHVFPIKALWAHLRNLKAEDGGSTFDEWADEASEFLRRHFTLAVITREQDKAIEKVGLKETGFQKLPFQRYYEATVQINALRWVEPVVPAFSWENFDPVGNVVDDAAVDELEESLLVAGDGEDIHLREGGN